MNKFLAAVFVFWLAIFLQISCSRKSKESLNDKIDSVKTLSPLVLWYTKPALQRDTMPYRNGLSTNIHGDPENKGWDEALPIGNARLAAMIFGGIERERIQLNEESLWSGQNMEQGNPDAAADLQEIRKLIFEGKNAEAQLLAEQKLTGHPQTMASYQSLADVFIDITDIGKPDQIADYYRELNLDSAIATVRFRDQHRIFTREVFASYTDDVIVVRITCDVPNSINAVISLTREAASETFRSPFDSTLLIQRGQIPSNKMQFETQVKAIYTGGSVKNATRKIIASKVDTLTLYISAATNYKTIEHAVLAKKTLLNAIAIPYHTLRNNHIHAYRQLFQRVSLDFDKAEDAFSAPTDLRLEKVKNGGVDQYLTKLMFQYGRYLLISSSKPGSLPANLQGKWNEHLNPLYGSGYKTEWTLPLIYSPSDITNLAELKQPLFHLTDTASYFGNKVASSMYKATGWTAHDYLSIFGNNYPTTHQLEAIPPLGAAWLVNSIFDSYLFNNDKELLKAKIYPLMKGCSRFLLDVLVEVPKGNKGEGTLVIIPSLSEENEFEKSDGMKSKLSYASALDQQLVYDVFTNTIKAIDHLSSDHIKYDPKFRQRLSGALKKLAIVPIDTATGEIQEWLENYKTTETEKNYISQLYGLYPSCQFSSNPELMKAAEVCLASETGKLKRSSHGNALNSIWWARLGKSGEALNYLNKQCSEATSSNLLSNFPPFAIDGNMIFTTAVAEMLLQSHNEMLNFLPAFPADLGDGYVNGLVARGGFVCNMAWSNGKIEVNIKSMNGNLCRIRLKKEVKIYSQGKNVNYIRTQPDLIEFETSQGQTYEINYMVSLKKKGKDTSVIPIDLGLGIKF